LLSPETLELYSTFLATLSLLALAGSVALVIYRQVKGAEAAIALLGEGGALWLAWLVAAVATIGSLIYSEVVHFVPCRLCWYQRIAMYPISVVLLVGSIRKEAVAKLYALPLSITGALISVWHYLTQTFPSLEGGSCDPTNPCSAKYVDVFGFVSIPFMAGAGFILITVLLSLYVSINRE
jgi:disulfide bond formation protein DsbB